MAEPATPAAPTPGPHRGSGVGAAVSTPSIIGPLAQYRPAAGVRSYVHEASITGATVADPAGLLARQPVLQDPHWASPIRWFATPLADHVLSMTLYWAAYGALQLLCVGLFALFTGMLGRLDGNTIIILLGFGPVVGVFQDFAGISSMGLTAPLYLAMLAAEPLLLFLFFFSSEWRDRFKCLGVLAGLIVVRALISVARA